MSCRSCRRSSRSAIARCLHSSAIAVGIILVGLLGDRVEARLGRRRTLWLGIGGLAGGSTLLCLAPAPWASISACFLMGALGGLLPAIVPAVLADLHGPRRAEAYAGQAIVAYAFGLAAPLLAGFARSGRSSAGALTSRSRDR